mgnify:CR=1 FL=1
MSSNHDREQGGSAGNDTDVVRAWRQASDEQPPARLDAAILGAARRSIEMKDESVTTRGVRARTRRRWMQWQPLAAAATVAGLAFVLVQTMPREHEVAPPIRMHAPGPAASHGGATPGGPGIRSAIGYPELCSYLDGAQSLEDTIALVAAATRRYARRQLTWLRKLRDAVIIDVQGRDPRGVAQEIAELVSR